MKDEKNIRITVQWQPVNGITPTDNKEGSTKNSQN